MFRIIWLRWETASAALLADWNFIVAFFRPSKCFFLSTGCNYFNVSAVPTDSSDLLQNLRVRLRCMEGWNSCCDKESSCTHRIYELCVCIIFNLKHLRKQASKWAVGPDIFMTIFIRDLRKNNSTLLQLLSRNNKTSKHPPTFGGLHNLDTKT